MHEPATHVGTARKEPATGWFDGLGMSGACRRIACCPGDVGIGGLQSIRIQALAFRAMIMGSGPTPLFRWQTGQVCRGPQQAWSDTRG